MTILARTPTITQPEPSPSDWADYSAWLDSLTHRPYPDEPPELDEGCWYEPEPEDTEWLGVMAARDEAMTRPDPDERREWEPEECERRGGQWGHPSQEEW